MLGSGSLKSGAISSIPDAGFHPHFILLQRIDLPASNIYTLKALHLESEGLWP